MEELKLYQNVRRPEKWVPLQIIYFGKSNGRTAWSTLKSTLFLQRMQAAAHPSVFPQVILFELFRA